MVHRWFLWHIDFVDRVNMGVGLWFYSFWSWLFNHHLNLHQLVKNWEKVGMIVVGGLKFPVVEQRTVGVASGFITWTGVAHRRYCVALSLTETSHGKMDAKYFQLIFFVIALIITVLNVYNRFFTKRVILSIQSIFILHSVFCHPVEIRCLSLLWF